MIARYFATSFQDDNKTLSTYEIELKQKNFIQ